MTALQSAFCILCLLAALFAWMAHSHHKGYLKMQANAHGALRLLGQAIRERNDAYAEIERLKKVRVVHHHHAPEPEPPPQPVRVSVEVIDAEFEVKGPPQRNRPMLE